MLIVLEICKGIIAYLTVCSGLRRQLAMKQWRLYVPIDLLRLEKNLGRTERIARLIFRPSLARARLGWSRLGCGAKIFRGIWLGQKTISAAHVSSPSPQKSLGDYAGPAAPYHQPLRTGRTYSTVSAILSTSNHLHLRDRILINSLSQTTGKMGEALIEGSNWRLVEVGRIVVIKGDHPADGRIAAIVEIIDHKRVR